MRDQYHSVCYEAKLSIKKDRNDKLEREAAELSRTFTENTFKGYSLLKRQHRTRSKAILPPEVDFANHYRSHYQLGPEEPLEVSSCELPPCVDDDTLTRDDFDAGVSSLNSNRAAGQDD